jgi:hypothetical protein
MKLHTPVGEDDHRRGLAVLAHVAASRTDRRRASFILYAVVDPRISDL